LQETPTRSKDTWHRFLLHRYSSLESHEETSAYILIVLRGGLNVTPAAPVSRIHQISQHQSTCRRIYWNSFKQWLHSPTVLMIPTKHVTRKTQCYVAHCTVVGMQVLHLGQEVNPWFACFLYVSNNFLKNSSVFTKLCNKAWPCYWV
jgi:hypothetical protein